MRERSGERALKYEVGIIGAGLAGICMAIRLRDSGIGRFTIFEKADEVGGTWRENTYPGVACDVPSHLYSYSFELNPGWSHAFSPGQEIQQYCKRCADRYGLRPHIRLGTEIVTARYVAGRWHLQAADGQRYVCDVLVGAMGGLHVPRWPDIPGREDFAGVAFHSARWNHRHDLAGRRVAMIGSAASATQIVPEIATVVDRLHVFQRTPNWVIARGDRRFPRGLRRAFRYVPGLARAYRWSLYAVAESRWPAFRTGSLANRLGRLVALRHLRRQVQDPALRRRLTPDYAPGCKRILRSDDYYPALQRGNVSLVDTGIAAIDRAGIVDNNGIHYPVDTLIFATGFKVFDVTSAVDIIGADGCSLGERWRSGIAAHRSVALPGFPNLFLLMGPNSALGHNSVIFMIEAQVRYVLGCLRGMQERGWQAMEPRSGSFEHYSRELDRDMRTTIWHSGCRSWYQDAGGRVFTLWPRTTVSYWRRMRRPDMNEYQESRIR